MIDSEGFTFESFVFVLLFRVDGEVYRVWKGGFSVYLG